MESIDSSKLCDEIKDLVVEDAPFVCRADALADINTVKAWADCWMVNFNTNIAPGCKASTLHSIAWDAGTKTPLYSTNFYAKHSDDGGPPPATNKETNTEYCYSVVMNDDNKCTNLPRFGMMRTISRNWAGLE
mmetsp:Transcript_23194/g.57200  ORF Transcript_23194/g.57200 Transcript_23194/m.57200 type:complete len:133 (-) Transcript_23194:332-730(-)